MARKWATMRVIHTSCEPHMWLWLTQYIIKVCHGDSLCQYATWHTNTDEQPAEFNSKEIIDSGSTSSQDIENPSTPHSQSSSDPPTTSSAPRYPQWNPDSMRTFGLCVTLETNNLALSLHHVLYLQLSPSCLLYLYNLIFSSHQSHRSFPHHAIKVTCSYNHISQDLNKDYIGDEYGLTFNTPTHHQHFLTDN